MIRALTNARILLPNGWSEGKAVIIEGGIITAIVPQDALPLQAKAEDLGGLDLVPGFIDSQVNGGGGVLFNDSPTLEAIEAIGIAHRKFGTTGFLPTLISDDLDVVRRGIEAVDAAIKAGIPGVLGIHIEGPFLNVARKGIHAADKLRALDEQGFEVVTGLRRGRTLITLAPECTTTAMIQRLADAGLIVAAGHTDASYAETRTALDSGLRGFTHLFNAMSPLTSREPGVVGAALEDLASYCGLIVDGYHVDPVTMRLALRCKGADLLMLVTDAMPSVGAAHKPFMLQGQRIEVRDGKCVSANGTLAGSDLDMIGAVRNAVEMLKVDLATALRMASASPAAFLGIADRRGQIAPGLAADLVLLNNNHTIARTWIGEQGV